MLRHIASRIPITLTSSITGTAAHKLFCFSSSHHVCRLLATETESSVHVKSSIDANFVSKTESLVTKLLSRKVNTVMETPPGGLPSGEYGSVAVLITQCCKLGTIQGMLTAQDLLNRLLIEKRALSSHRHIVPFQVFDTVIFGWAKLADASQSRIRMREIFALLEKEHEFDREQKEPDTVLDREYSSEPTIHTYNTLLRGLSIIANKDAEAAFEAEKVLNEMVENSRTKHWRTKPNTKSFYFVIKAYEKTAIPGAGFKAEGILKQMEEFHIEETRAYELKFGRPYDVENPEQNVHRIATPDARVYAAVIKAIVDSQEKSSTERAYEMMNTLIDKGKPIDAYTINNVISGFARLASSLSNPKLRAQKAEKAEELALLLLDKHKEMCVVADDLSADELRDYWKKQLSISCNIAITAWARSDVKESSQRAQSLLQRMAESESLQVDKVSLNAAIQAWARSFEPEKAEGVLNVMIDQYEAGNLSCRPDIVSYGTVMNAWARSDRPEKTKQTIKLLEIVLSKYRSGMENMKPDNIVFTTILNSAIRFSGNDNDGPKEDAYRLALQTYEEVLNDRHGLGIKPDSFLFSTMLKVIDSHTDISSAERRHMIETVFNDACAAGQVGSDVVRQVRSVSPDIDLVSRLFQSQDLAKHLPSIFSLKPEWTRNVPRKPRFVEVDEKGFGRNKG
jgi:hypothetical protein